MGPIGRVQYIGGFGLPSTRARAIQTVNTAHALARAGVPTRLLVERVGGRRVDPSASLAALGLEPTANLQITDVRLLSIEKLQFVEIHKRLAVANWTYGFGCVLDTLRARPRPTVVLARDPRLAWMFLKTRRLHRLPVVYEVHEVFGTRPRDNRDAARQWGVARRTIDLERTVFGGADALLPLTTACAAYIHEAMDVATPRITVVPDATAAPSGRIPPRGSGGVIYAGQLYPWKGVDVLVRAMACVVAPLTIVGGDGAADPNAVELRRVASECNAAARVTFAGHVPPREVRARLTDASVAVVPLPDNLMARTFTSPLKLFEYMAAGVPIVASDLASIREVLTHGEDAILVPPSDPPALARGIRMVLDDSALAERLRRAAFDKVRNYTWERRAERIIGVVAAVSGG
jgi:glycosyltransferase involved in cell wall biosynthesis